MTNKPINEVLRLSVVGGKSQSEEVGSELLDTAAFLRKLASRIESGAVVAIGVAFVTKDLEVGWDHRFDRYGHTLLGMLTRAQVKLSLDLDKA